jgi:hypothetical protein
VENYWIWSIASSACLTALAIALILLSYRQHQRWQWRMLRMQAQSMKESRQFSLQMAKHQLELSRQSAVLLAEPLRLVDKAMALLSTTDPLVFQQVQVMGTPSEYDDFDKFDPSDEGELKRIDERSGKSYQEDDVNGFESSFLTDLADAGIDSEFFDIPDPHQTPAS